MEVILIKNKFLPLNFLLIYLLNGVSELKIRFNLQFLFYLKFILFIKSPCTDMVKWTIPKYSMRDIIGSARNPHQLRKCVVRVPLRNEADGTSLNPVVSTLQEKTNLTSDNLFSTVDFISQSYFCVHSRSNLGIFI